MKWDRYLFALMLLLSIFIVSSCLAKTRTDTNESVGIIKEVTFMQGNFSHPTVTIVKTTTGVFALWGMINVPINVNAYLITASELGVIERWLFWDGNEKMYRLKSR